MFRHRFDPSSLIAAVVFLGVAVCYLGGRPPVWAAPGVAVALGIVLVLRGLFRSRRHEP
ncbi:hypothetical protein [Actinoallomurus soli]|uniref:hypothetical protein n=1 Tax=Actinoallomurus soli TaxID=2952535 RepID=UPI0020920538|nr:hypothetical protein [Actinoallomurus soli]MCO5969403.1 hypothetical protein [Actinoallomurus soli]